MLLFFFPNQLEVIWHLCAKRTFWFALTHFAVLACYQVLNCLTVKQVDALQNQHVGRFFVLLRIQVKNNSSRGMEEEEEEEGGWG